MNKEAYENPVMTVMNIEGNAWIESTESSDIDDSTGNNQLIPIIP